MIKIPIKKSKKHSSSRIQLGFLGGKENGESFLSRIRRSVGERKRVTSLQDRHTPEHVVLVDRENNEIGTAQKDTVHTTDTPLHRGFSLFLFNSKNELLLTKRSSKKKTFPGVWTNTVCGHPEPEETAEAAARRRLQQELGITISDIKEVAPYRYRFTDANGIVENEICPILVAYSDADPNPDQKETEGWRWMRWEDFLEDIKKNPDVYSPWSREEAALIAPLI